MRLTYLTLSNKVGKAVWVSKMAALAIACFKHSGINCSRLKTVFQGEPIFMNHVRNNHMFKYLANKTEHDTEYAYEVSKDPKEWEFVEKLMPLETVPTPKPKPSYPSGWRPPKEEALKEPYYVERSKNHMLSVYLKIFDRGNRRMTIVRKISGDLWKLHNDLKAHIEKEIGRKVASSVQEGNNTVYFKGDCVYYVEQWMLSKGF